MFLSRKTGLIVFALLVGGWARAEMEPCSVFDDTEVAPETLDSMRHAATEGRLFRIDAATSQVRFCVESSFDRVHGEFADIAGGLALHPGAHLDGQALVLIKANSLDTGNSLFNRIARSESFFATDRHPEILFVSTAFEWTSETEGNLHGRLTLHGVTRPITFRVSVEPNTQSATSGNDRQIVIHANARLQRSSFGMTDLKGLVEDDVRLCLKVEADRLLVASAT